MAPDTTTPNDLSVAENIRRLYDYAADADLEWRRLGAVGKADHIVKLCKAYPHRSVLEIGAGEGAVLRRLSDLRFAETFTGLEITESAVSATLKGNIRALRECRLFDGYHIPDADNTFDLAVISHVIEHVEYPRKLLYEAKRVARYVFVEVPLEETVRQKRDFTFDRVGHINSYTRKSIRRFLQTAGLVVLDELVTNRAYAVYRHCFGWQALPRYSLKELLLAFVPAVATGIFTYDCSLICGR